eukprot:4978263-Amphidinium_carterae.1
MTDPMKLAVGASTSGFGARARLLCCCNARLKHKHMHNYGFALMGVCHNGGGSFQNVRHPP